MVFLPSSNPNVLERIQYLYTQPVYNMESLNAIFFSNQCCFFPIIQQNFPAEAFEFLKVYKFLSQMALNTMNILPPSIQLLKKMQNMNRIELSRRQVALLFLLSFFGVCIIHENDS